MYVDSLKSMYSICDFSHPRLLVVDSCFLLCTSSSHLRIFVGASYLYDLRELAGDRVYHLRADFRSEIVSSRKFPPVVVTRRRDGESVHVEHAAEICVSGKSLDHTRL